MKESTETNKDPNWTDSTDRALFGVTVNMSCI